MGGAGVGEELVSLPSMLWQLGMWLNSQLGRMAEAKAVHVFASLGAHTFVHMSTSANRIAPWQWAGPAVQTAFETS